MQEPTVQSFFDPGTATVTHTSADRVIEHVRQAGLTVAWLLETHAHADHLSAAPYLKAQLGGQMGIGRHICDVQAVFKQLFNAPDMNTEGAEFDHLFEDGEQFQIGALDVRVMHTPGHTPAWVTTVRQERETNIHVHDGITQAEFVSMRTARDKTLAMPRLLLPSVQVNVRAGQLPPPEDNGVRYLKIPINVL